MRLFPLLLWLLLSAPAVAFPVKFPGRDSEGNFVDPEPIKKEYPIGEITLDPRLLKLGDEVIFSFVLPSKSSANTDFYSYNKGLPDWIAASNADALPMPITGGADTDHAIIYTVVEVPTASQPQAFQVWGLSETQKSLGPGDSLVLPIKCVPFIL